MAQITINIPDAQLPRVVEAISENHGWKSDSGMTRGQFAKRYLIDTMIANVRHYEASRAEQVARQDAETKVDAEVILS